MAGKHFDKLRKAIDRKLTAIFWYKDRMDDMEPILNLNFMPGLVGDYHYELRKNLKLITAKVKAKKWDVKGKYKNQQKFYLAYQKELINELKASYPEIASLIKTDTPNEASLSFLVGQNIVAPKIVNDLSQRVREGLRERSIPANRVETALNIEFGEITAGIVVTHMNSIGFNDAYEVGKQAEKTNERLNQAAEDRAEKQNKYLTVLTNNSGGDPKNWVITSGMFNGKTLEDVSRYLSGEAQDEEIKKLDQKYKKDLLILKGYEDDEMKLLESCREQFRRKRLRKTTIRKITSLEQALAYEKYLDPFLIDKLKTRISIGRNDKLDKLKRIQFEYTRRYKIIRASQTKAANWILNTYATIHGNPNAFGSFFKVRGLNARTGISESLAMMFKEYDKKVGLFEAALNTKNILALHQKRTDDFFYTTTQFIVGRDGVKRERKVTRYKMPRQNDEEGFAPSDTSSNTSYDKRKNFKETPGMFAEGRLYNKRRNKDADPEASKRKREEDYGFGGRHSMLRKLALGMSPHDKVKFEKLRDVLKNLPQRPTKEVVIDPLTGEQKLIRRGSKLGLMLVMDRHGKLSWKEFDVYGKARRALGGSLQRMRDEAIKEQKLNVWMIDSMLSDDLGSDKNRKAEIVDVVSAEKESGGVLSKNKTRGVKFDPEYANDKLDAVKIGTAIEKTREKYADLIAGAQSHEALDKISTKIYTSLTKNVDADFELKKMFVDIEGVEKFRRDGDLLPEGYSGPTVTLDQMKLMREGGPAGVKFLRDFQEAQANYYAGPQSNSGRKEEYSTLDYQLPIQTQIAVRRMELRNSGVKG